MLFKEDYTAAIDIKNVCIQKIVHELRFAISPDNVKLSESNNHSVFHI